MILVAQYGEKVILEDISVDIYPGEVTVILGGSGCGKTTLLRNILRLQEPHAGQVEIFGKSVLELDETEFDTILRRIGMLFQNGALLNSISLYDNISIPLELHTELAKELIDRIIRVKLHLVNLDHAANLL
ncbi:MAG TPA: ATP-binding cassette domain-containing protein, partial [Candidatus Cloacimonadota bacterium]|nr:ATP-binding cassette domain-containing protein [Candidatus Cloacimonadota bacterium]